MKRRQQNLQATSMMRGAGGAGGAASAQFTPGIAQFSAPRAIDNDPYVRRAV